MATLDLSSFRAAVSQSFVPLRVTTPVPDTFRGVVRQQDVGGITFTSVHADAQTVERTPELIRRCPRDAFKVSLQMEGTSRLEQNGRIVTLTPGDLAVYDTSRPYRLTFTLPFRVMVIQVPHDRFDLPADLVEDMTAVCLDGTQGLGRVISPFLLQLGGNLDALSGPAGMRLGQNAVDLLRTLFTGELGTTEPGASSHGALMHRIRDHIDDRLADRDLTPTSIAAAVFISTRHLHSLFHEQGMTVASYIRLRRLERCYRDLVDPAHAGDAVASIGARWGFPDAAHFSRTFKSTYHESPAALRRRVLTQTARSS